jgi:hypothetical protein
MVGILVPPKVDKVLSSINPKSRTVSHAETVLAKQGLDFYGNKVDYQEFAGGGHILFVSGRGNVFGDSGTFYERLR